MVTVTSDSHGWLSLPSGAGLDRGHRPRWLKAMVRLFNSRKRELIDLRLNYRQALPLKVAVVLKHTPCVLFDARAAVVKISEVEDTLDT